MEEQEEQGGKTPFGDADRELAWMIESGRLAEAQYVEGTSWAHIDLEPYKRGEQVIAPPAFMRVGERALLYPGRPHVFFGESESLKSWAAILACREVTAEGYSALYVDFEGTEASFVERCRTARIPEAVIGGALRYAHPTEPLLGSGPRTTLARSQWVEEVGGITGLVVFDGVSECYALHDWNINSAEDAARFQHAFRIEGPASIAIDHTAKEAGRGILRSQHKRAGLDGAAYEFRIQQAGGRGKESSATLRVQKDRHGHVRGWSPAGGLVARLRVSDAEGVVLEEPGFGFANLVDPDAVADSTVRDFLRDHPGATARAIREKTGFRNMRIADSLHRLESRGEAVNSGSKNKSSWSLAS